MSTDMNNSNIPNTDIAVLNRKFAKTCVEKKRRDRINKCLDELKDLMSQTEDKARYQKMEKAEILEMAVNYMKNMRQSNPEQFMSQQQQQPAQNQESTNMQYYNIALRQCLVEFQNFLSMFPGIKDDFKMCIMNYMTQRYMESLAQASAAKTAAEQSRKSCQKARYSPYNNPKQTNTLPIKKIKNEMSINTNESTCLSSSMSSSSSSYLYTQESSKFGGSCSSLDSYTINGVNNLQMPTSPALSTTTTNSDCNNDSVVHDTSSMSACSSPLSTPQSASASPVNKKVTIKYNDSFDNSDGNVWRPW